jgi:type I restriction enzyme R subunit
MSKKNLNETEICQNFITPAITRAGWDQLTQIRREFPFTAGRVIVRGNVAVRGKKKRADYLLFFESNLPLAVVEAKDNSQPVGGGMPQALAYAETLDVPYAFSSNGDGFLFHDRTGRSTPIERTLTLHEFPTRGRRQGRTAARPGAGSAETALSASSTRTIAG